jgi:hypothetical protein
MTINKRVRDALLDNYEAYRNGDNEYAIYLHGGRGRYNNLNKADVKKYQKIGEALGGDYKLLDQGCYYYVTAGDLAAVGIDDPELLDYIDNREAIKRDQELIAEREAKEAAKDARLLGQYEEVLSVYIDDPAKLYQVAKHLVDTAKEAA